MVNYDIPGRKHFTKLVLEGRTLYSVRENMSELGFDLDGFSDVELLREMIHILRRSKGGQVLAVT